MENRHPRTIILQGKETNVVNPIISLPPSLPPRGSFQSAVKGKKLKKNLWVSLSSRDKIGRSSGRPMQLELATQKNGEKGASPRELWRATERSF